MNIIANTTAAVFRSFADRYRATYQPPSGASEMPRMGINRYIVLAEDEETALNVARRAYRPWYAHFMTLWHKYDKHPGVNYPPEIDGQLADGRAIATTPAKALSSLRAQLAESGANYLVLRFAFGDLALSESLRSLELFQRQVMPGLRESVAVAAE
jgi:alkanesulfonate monooxygenase SsuD/methylene tetrahydromethanopterin reductase-like flavin-dependent oxidoreductase (luciferase family)